MPSPRLVHPAVAWRFKTLLWYLKRPGLYRQLLRNLGKGLIRRRCPIDTAAEAERWCRQRAIEVPEAVGTLTMAGMREPVRKRFPDVFARAEQAAAACPVKMGGPANLDLLYWVAEQLQARYVIETGVAYGWSSLAVLLSLAGRDGSLLLSTDVPYTNRDNDKYVGCVVPQQLRSRWQIVRRPDRDALPGALRRLPWLDMCHYDSDKSYQGRMWTYPRLWNALRPGGYFISDDVADNLAFRDFCRRVDADPIIVETAGKYVGMLIKPAA